MKFLETNIDNFIFPFLKELYSEKECVSIETICKELSIINKHRLMLIFLGDTENNKIGGNNLKKELVEFGKKSLTEKLKNYPKILDLIRHYLPVSTSEKKDFGEVFTNIECIKDQLSLLDESFFQNKDNKVLDCCCGIGNYYFVLLEKFFYGLKNEIPDEEKRVEYVINNMLCAVEYQPKNMAIFLILIEMLGPNLKPNFHRGDYLELNIKEKFGIDSFSLITTNPPYQSMDGGAKASAKPIYNLFVEKAIKESEKVIMITPSRWFAGGKGLDNYRKMMLNRKDVKVIKHIDNACDIFGKDVEIKGGVSYFLIDKIYNGETDFNGTSINLNEFDVVVSNTESYKIIGKVSKFPNISTMCNPRSFFGISIGDNRLSDTKLNKDYIKCFVSQFKGYEKWININDIKNKEGLKYYRVATPRAATRGGEGFGNLFIVKENECLSDSYISFFVNNELEAKSLLSYLKTKFANFLLSVRKVSQTVKGDTCKWIPLVPFDREWNDEELFDYFNISEEEKNLILGNAKFKFEIITDNNEKIDFEGYIKELKYDTYGNFDYSVTIDKELWKRLRKENIGNFSFKNRANMPLVFSGDLSFEETQNIQNQYRDFYFIRKIFLSGNMVNQFRDMSIFIHSIVTEEIPKDLDIEQDHINSEWRIKKFHVFYNGEKIEETDIKKFVREIKVAQILQ